MKKKMTHLLATACLIAAGAFLPGCQKDLRKSEPAAATVKAVAANGAHRAAARSADEGGEYSFTEITVELTDEGRQNLLRTGKTEIVKTGDLAYRTIQGNGGTTNPNPEPYDPYVCDGMTYSQAWADIGQKFNAFLNSPAGQALQDRANATCKPQFFGVCNCFICMLCVMQPNRPCYSLEEAIRVPYLDAQLIAIAP